MTSFDAPDAPDSYKQSWPNPEADLLGTGPEWWLVACMDWSRDRWIGYVGGYSKAADVIFERILQTGRDQDMLIYPYLMCWRHYVELQMKNLILQSRRYLHEEISLLRTHRLDLLWHATRQCLERAWPDEENYDLKDAGRIILQLNGFDPTSEHFRYPTLKDGTKTLSTLGRIYLPSFQKAMTGVAAMLDAADLGLRVMADEEAEIEAEYARRDQRDE
jgi:hypothetical protein